MESDVLRITFLLPPANMSGGIRVVAIYAQALANKGHEVTLVSPPRRPIPFIKRIKALIKGVEIPSSKQCPSHLDGLEITHKVLECFRPITDKDVPNADVVIATWWETAEWVNSLSTNKGVKVYFVQGHEVFDYLPVDRCKATYKMPLHKITISQWLVDVMRDEYGDNDVDLVPNSIDHSQFFAPARGKQTQPTVGFLYHEMPFKGMNIVLAALEKLHDVFPDLRAVCFGSELPSSKFKLERYIEFHHAPAQEHIRDLYAMCDVWVTASRSEGFNLPAMEAMACGTPVISTRTGWPAESVLDGWNGKLADIDDIEGFALGIKDVLELPESSWREMSEHAYLTVAQSSWEASATLFETALNNACERRKV